MTFNVTVLETKATKTDWADGDKIYVFFNGLETKYLVLSYDGTEWSNTSVGGTLLDSDFSGLGTKTLTAVHFPMAVDVAYADSKFSFTNGGKPVYNFYLFETGKVYTVDGTTVNATLLMGKPEGMVQIHVEGIQASVADYTFGCSKIRPVACASVGTDGTITESILQAGARMSGVADTDGAIFAGRLVYPGETKNYKFTVASDTQIYTLTRTGRILTTGKMYNFPSLSTTGGSNWTVQNASDLYVDLGIEVNGKKIYWAKCNVGAASETEYGDYFAWGEITGYNEGKTSFSWDTYAWGTSSETITKYCSNSSYGKDGFTDALTTLLPEDDAAYAALGGKFRMPIDAEINALYNTKTNTDDYTWTWCDGSTEKYNDSTTPGWKIVKNSTLATLFLPASGNWIGTNLQYEYEKGNGVTGYCWSSSLDSSYPYCAYRMLFRQNHVFAGGIFRYYGSPVRPVSE